MKRILKYPLEAHPSPKSSQTLLMPREVWPLCVQMQEGPCLWAMGDDEQPLEERTIRVINTGDWIPDADRLSYVGTYQLQHGLLVFHVFLAGRASWCG